MKAANEKINFYISVWRINFFQQIIILLQYMYKNNLQVQEISYSLDTLALALQFREEP